MAPAAFRGATAFRCRALRPRGFGAPTAGSSSNSSSSNSSSKPSAVSDDGRSEGGAGTSEPHAGPSAAAAAPVPASAPTAAAAATGSRSASSACAAPRPHLAVFAPPLGDLPRALPLIAPLAVSVDLSGQHLPPGSGTALGALPALAELQLRSCSLAAGDLAALLAALRAPGAPALRALGICDLRVTGPGNDGGTLAEGLVTVGLPPSLRSLAVGLVSGLGSVAGSIQRTVA